MGDLLDSFEKSVSESRLILPVDEGLVAAGRKVAQQIDRAVESGEGQEVTKALYLTPHLVNILKEMLATPAARKAAKIDDKGAAGGKLSVLRQGQRPA